MLGLKISREHGLELIVFHCSKGGGSSSTSNSCRIIHMQNLCLVSV